MSENRARFHFKSKTLEVEFEGAETFVEGQLRHLEAAMTAEARRAGAPAAQPAPSTPAAVAATGGGQTVAPASRGSEQDPSLEQFYRRAKSREGRGALQETILIFAYFLREYRAKEDFSIENLNACFSLVGVTPPKSLANTLGIMKRNQKFFHSGIRRGHYQLTEKGVAYVRRLIGA
jgi:hypothetical protein